MDHFKRRVKKKDVVRVLSANNRRGAKSLPLPQQRNRVPMLMTPTPVRPHYIPVSMRIYQAYEEEKFSWMMLHAHVQFLVECHTTNSPKTAQVASNVVTLLEAAPLAMAGLPCFSRVVLWELVHTDEWPERRLAIETDPATFQAWLTGVHHTLHTNEAQLDRWSLEATSQRDAATIGPPDTVLSHVRRRVPSGENVVRRWLYTRYRINLERDATSADRMGARSDLYANIELCPNNWQQCASDATRALFADVPEPRGEGHPQIERRLAPCQEDPHDVDYFLYLRRKFWQSAEIEGQPIGRMRPSRAYLADPFSTVSVFRTSENNPAPITKLAWVFVCTMFILALDAGMQPESDASEDGESDAPPTLDERLVALVRRVHLDDGAQTPGDNAEGSETSSNEMLSYEGGSDIGMTSPDNGDAVATISTTAASLSLSS